MLADPFLRVRAEAFEKSAHLGVSRQASQEIVGDCGQGVVATQTLVEGWLESSLRGCGIDRSGKREAQQQQGEGGGFAGRHVCSPWRFIGPFFSISTEKDSD